VSVVYLYRVKMGTADVVLQRASFIGTSSLRESLLFNAAINVFKL
jgi:hypothetical protein